MMHCSCGCSRTSIWHCYNTSLTQLQESSMDLNFTFEAISFIENKFAITLMAPGKQGKGWEVNTNGFTSLQNIIPFIKPSFPNNELEETYAMLQACDLDDLPTRIAHYCYVYVNTIF
jgi:hypothetical protein